MSDTFHSTDGLGASGDEFYAALVEAHKGLGAEDSARLNARLVLLLANQVADQVDDQVEDLAILRAAIEAARDF